MKRIKELILPSTLTVKKVIKEYRGRVREI